MLKPRRPLTLLDGPLHRARRKHRAHRGREPATAPRPPQPRRKTPRRALAADRESHRRRRGVFQIASARDRPGRDGISGFSNRKSKFNRPVHLRRARKRPHGARPAHGGIVGGIEPPVFVRAFAAGAQSLAAQPQRIFSGNQGRLAASERHRQRDFDPQ